MWKHEGGKKYGVCEFVFAEELHIPSRYYPNDEWFALAFENWGDDGTFVGAITDPVSVDTGSFPPTLRW